MRFRSPKTKLAILTGLLVPVVLTTSPIPGVSATTTISQLGSDIDGVADGDNSGYSVAMSSDGTRIAIGAPYSDNNTGNDSGQVRVYDWDGSTWTQIGGDIEGVSPGESGSSVAMSSDGTRIAIGAPFFSEGAEYARGRVRVYELSGSTWTQIGADIDGEADINLSGYSVAMSSDGTRIAIGAPYNNNGGGPESGHVRVYELSGSTWTQIGSDIDGVFDGDESGTSVAMSSDGTRIAIGAPRHDGNGSNSGHVRVYAWDGVSGDPDGINGWTQLGDDINGEALNDRSGTSVTMSSDGTRIAIGAYGNDADTLFSNRGHVRVYAWDGVSGDPDGINGWTQLGDDIDGEAANDESGRSVAMSSDGTRIAIGATEHGDGGSLIGHVRVYDWDGSTWTQIGSDIDGESLYDRSGTSVAMSSNGTRIAIGAPYNDGITTNSERGHVRVFSISATLAITYDSQGGNAVSDGDTTTTSGGSITTLPTNPTRSGYTFNGWYTATSGGTQITAGTAHGQTANFTLYAQWSVAPLATSTAPATSTTTTTSTVPIDTMQPTPSIPITELPSTGTNSTTSISVALIFLALGILTYIRTRRFTSRATRVSGG